VLLNKGYSLRAAAQHVKVTEGCIRYAIRKDTIVREKKQKEAKGSDGKPKSTSERSTEDKSCGIGIGAKWEADRVLASNRKLVEAAQGAKHLEEAKLLYDF